jgi:hypothetical protein
VNQVKLTEIYSNSYGSDGSYSLREVYINPTHVVCLRSEDNLKRKLDEGRLVDGMDKRQFFTRVSVGINTSHDVIIVVGSIDEVHKKLNIDTRTLLRG